MDPLVIVVTVVAVVLCLVLLVVGVQTILVLQQMRQTLARVNRLTESAENNLNRAIAPLQNLGGMMEGMRTGFRMLELFSSFLHKQSSADDEIALTDKAKDKTDSK